MTVSASIRPLKIVAIGNSRGVRLPQSLLRRYGMADHVMLEERPDGLLLRGSASRKASLKQTFTEMAREQATGAEDWHDLDRISCDGLHRLKW